MKTSSEASKSAVWTQKESEVREDERILEEVWDAMGLFGGFLGTGMFAVFSKTDCKVMNQWKRRKAKVHVIENGVLLAFRLPYRPVSFQVCLILRHFGNQRSFTLSSFLQASPDWVFSSCWSISGATPFG